MKNILTIVAIALAFSVTASADDRPVDYKKLPSAAKEFVKKYFPGDKVLSATKDDDFVKPEYSVYLSGGAKIDFEHNGDLEKIQMRGVPVPAEIVPVKIRTYVDSHYPALTIVEYEVGKADYEVKLSNGLELKFSRSFRLVDIDD